MANENGSNGNGNGNGNLPPWGRVLVTLVIQNGLPAAIAAYLVWMLAGGMKSDMAELKAQTRTVCIMVAKTDDQRALCGR